MKYLIGESHKFTLVYNIGNNYLYRLAPDIIKDKLRKSHFKFLQDP